MKKNVDMTTGSPFKKILAFSIPLALGFLLQNLYTLCDALIVSLARGKDAVTGINITSPFVFMITGFAQGTAAGFGIVLSQFLGAKDFKNMKNSLATSIVLSVILGAILTVATLFSAHGILILMNTNQQFFEYSEKYVKALFSGIIFTIFYNLADQTMRAMGDSKTPLIILILSTVINLSLNCLLFVTKLPPEWTGWTTIISQALSSVIAFIVIFKKYSELHLAKSNFKFSFAFAWKHLKVGIPMALEFSITAISCMIQQKAFNSLTNPKYAMAQGTGSKIDGFINAMIFGSTNSFSIYCGQNYGAKRIDRVKQGAKSGLLIGLICSTFCCIAGLLLSRPLGSLLLNTKDDELLKYVFQYIGSQAVFYYFLYILVMYRQSLQGLGKSFLAMFGGGVELLMRIIGAEVLAKNFGYTGACFSNPLAWFGGALFYSVCLIIVVKKLDKIMPSEKISEV